MTNHKCLKHNLNQLYILGEFTVFGLTTKSTTASVRSNLWTNKLGFVSGTSWLPGYEITYLPSELDGSTLLQTEYGLDTDEVIVITTTVDVYISIGVSVSNGYFVDVEDSSRTSWTKSGEWYVEYQGYVSTGSSSYSFDNGNISDIWSKPLVAGESLRVTVSASSNLLIFVSKGIKCYIILLIFGIKK